MIWLFGWDKCDVLEVCDFLEFNSLLFSKIGGWGSKAYLGGLIFNYLDYLICLYRLVAANFDIRVDCLLLSVCSLTWGFNIHHVCWLKF